MNQYLRIISLLCVTAGLFLHAQPRDYNAEGADRRVDYNQLYRESTRAGIPWDDRNLTLTSEKLATLPPRDHEDRRKIPLFYRVLFRERVPGLNRSGLTQYPRSATEKFELEYGGILRDGKYEDEKKKRGSSIELGAEVDISSPVYAAETAIAINPVNPNLVVAGSNGSGGQWHYYSNDGGASWTPSPGANPIPNSCCDPTMAWSPDGTLAYGVTLGGPGGVWFYRSTDNGMTWTRTATVSSSGGDDKEYVHVDTFDCGNNPHCGNIYISWHQSNVMRVARSTDQGNNFDVFVHTDSNNAIGSDITSNANGEVLHFWPESNGTMLMSKSVDGGASFAAKQVIANTNGNYEYEIPAMDQRRAFIYISTAVDLTGGPFHNRIYACWNDHDNAVTSGNPSENHSKITIAWSADGGSTWNFSTPHETNDIQTVDRFHPWMEIDGSGRVHVLFYDTRNDAARRNPDIYHAYSSDGGVTWQPPTRVTSVSSEYLTGFQWGDYNGMSILGNEIRGIWTDNRPGNGTHAFTREMSVLSSQGDFSLSAISQTMQSICRGTAITPVTIQVSGENGFNGPVSFSLEPNPLPTGFSGSITGSPVTPPGTVTVNLETDLTAAAGAQSIRLVGTSDSLVHDLTLNVTVLPQVATAVPLWQGTGTFDPIADVDGNGRIDLLDLLGLISCTVKP